MTPTPIFTDSIEFVRTGEFSLDALGDYHCSTVTRPTIRYRVYIRAKNSPLDARGFLFDQLDCPAFFTSIGSTELSCERLAKFCCSSLYQVIIAENPALQIELMELTLTPEPFEVSITQKLEVAWP